MKWKFWEADKVPKPQITEEQIINAVKGLGEMLVYCPICRIHIPKEHSLHAKVKVLEFSGTAGYTKDQVGQAIMKAIGEQPIPNGDAMMLPNGKVLPIRMAPEQEDSMRNEFVKNVLSWL